MAARLNRRHQDQIRKKIRGSAIVMHIQKLALEGVIFVNEDGVSARWRSVTPEDAPIVNARLRAMFGLLNKIVPDVATVELTGADGGPLEITDPGMSQIEAARRIAFTFRMADEAIRKAQEAGQPVASLEFLDKGST